MSEVLTAAGIMTGVALLFGAILAVAYRFLRVEEDPRIDGVEELLPSTNCGACGQPGCRAFAEKLVEGVEEPSGCTVSSADEIVEIAEYLGVAAGERVKLVARLRCAGGESNVKHLANYDGLASCRAAVQVNSGGIACAWGCLGLADCEVACTFDAISMTDDLLPLVDIDKCTSCNDCVEICPRDLFVLQPLNEPLLVQCATPLASDAATAICKVACDACGRCAKDAASGVIVMENGLPVIKLPEQTSIDCIARCPTGAIRWVETLQFQAEESQVEGEWSRG